MGLTAEQLSDVYALWEEWTADRPFQLDIDVRDDGEPGVMVTKVPGGIGTRFQSTLYCQVEIRVVASGFLVFSERVPHDHATLRASVLALAKHVASHGPLAQAD